MHEYYAEITRLAPMLDTLPADRNATITYDLNCDALLWSDEAPTPFLVHDFVIFQYLLRYRTGLIFGMDQSALRPYWETAMRAFPNWPGFAPDRCKASSELQDRYNELKAQASALVRAAFRG